MTKEAKISDKTDDLVAALKSLKVNQKRKLNILILHAAGIGESAKQHIEEITTLILGRRNAGKDSRN